MKGSEARGVAARRTEDFEVVTGQGVIGRVDGRAAALGNRTLIAAQGAELGALEAHAAVLEMEGRTAMCLAVEGRAAGVVVVADRIKDSAAGAIRGLHAAGLRIVMATGDNERTARAVANAHGIDEVHAGVLP